ncbi:RHS repeat domain-containing protein [Massilia norwichensis]|uniref:RHS repeat protein n=1 Tax=Massilia norwichensis TaxID=1442366 RepID=A0ABT2A413_9BURK|nr:hypothetical protein [Massilia norwichensis]MCS0588936.1 hypothetical protein [Massilia norwichensis]
MKTNKKFAVLTIAMAVQAAYAQTATTYSDQNKLIRAPQAVTRLGADLFGDKVNLYTGGLEFIQKDVSLPGNSGLPVEVGRHIKVGEDWLEETLFGRWDIEIPHLHGIFSRQKGWTTTGGTTARCSQFSRAPDATSPTASWSGTEYWHGSFIYVPGVGDQEMLQRSTEFQTAPTGNSYPIVTRNNWAIRCLSSMAAGNGSSGEAFVAVSPDGTEYRFDWMVSRNYQPLEKSSSAPELSNAPVAPEKADGAAGSPETSATTGTTTSVGGGVETPTVPQNPQLSRVEIWILPTQVTDRFGNTVTYTYDTTNKWQLKSIVANDASGASRTITLNYQTPGSTASNLVSSVTDGTRTWRYAYDSIGQLQTVTLPDGSAWQLSGIGNLLSGIQYLGGGSCDVPGNFSPSEITGSMTHPSGAIGNFMLTATRHGRSNVFYDCRHDLSNETYKPMYAKNFDTYALTKKTISGPGLLPLTWRTQYPVEASSWAPCNNCVDTKTVSVTDPAGNITRHTFGTLFQQTEGQPASTETVSASGEVLRSTSLHYREPVAPRGYSLQPRGDGTMAARTTEVDRRDTVQQGATFTWEATEFDSFARPTKVNRYSSLNSGRVEQTLYEDNLTKWILGQVKQVTELNTGKVMQLNTFDPNVSTVLSVTKFGKLQNAFTYYTDGTIKTVSDGKNPPTTYSNYKRGIAQRIDYPDGSFETAAVDNLGKITSLTNEAGSTHFFGYDAMGRLASITYPSADSVTWNQTTLSFAPVGAQEYDLGAGHWKQTVTTGGAKEISYLDALWRPIYVERYDSTDAAGTSRIVKRQYDFEACTTFESYPQRNYQSISGGVSSGYDALGRLTTQSTSSELGTLNEYYYYLDGFRKQYVDAKGNSTYYSYQAFDQPSEDAITSVTMPEGVALGIARDVFDKTKSITRSGAGLSQTRSYVYDGNERLCKTIEPETGATVQDYDLANNVAWRATGLALPSTTSCNTTSVTDARKMSFTYDLRNRLKDTSFGDGSAAINRTYTLDGLQDTVSSNGSKWTYSYNKRRLLEGESLAYGGTTYSIGRSYDANGSLTQLRYPGNNLTVAYNPNALGEPRQAGTYATGVTYHPSGAIAGFTYGNGIRRTLAQNTRGLPSRSTDAGVLDESYTYDKNANVESIVDQLQSLATRSMTYDGLNRLKTTTASNLWGTATYGYDTLDNLTSTSISGGANSRSTIHNIDYTTNRLASITNGPAKFNFAYGYDAQGNITSRGAQSYTFDMANRMTAAAGRATYVYDGLGRRVSVVGTDGVNRIQVYSQGGQLLYVAPTSGTATKYIYLHNHQIAEVK